MDIVLTDASLFRLVVSFQGGLPGRIFAYWQQHQSLAFSNDDADDLDGLSETGALVAIAIRRGDIAILEELLALSSSSSYYRTMPLLQFRDVMYFAACCGQETVLAWAHSTRRETVTCDSLAAAAVALRGHAHALQWLFQHCHDCTKELSVETATDVVERGHTDVIQCIYDFRPELFRTPEVLKRAVVTGRLDIVQWIHERIVPTAASRYCKGLLDAAAGAGQLDVLRYLHCECTEYATTEAMNVAAANGHLDVVKFLHTHRSEGCTVYAIDQAAAQGHLDVVQFLHENRREGCTVYAMGGASRRGHLDIVQYLHEHRSEGCSSWALAEAAEKGHLEVVKFLLAHKIGIEWEDSSVFRAARNGHLAVVEYLCDHTRVGDRLFDARRAAKTAGHDAIVRVLDTHIKKLLEERDQEQRERLRRQKHAKSKKKRK